MGSEKTLELVGEAAAKEFRNLKPDESDIWTYDKIIANDFLIHFSSAPRPLLMTEYEEMLAKICFLSSKELTIETYGRSSDPRERNGWGDLPISIGGNSCSSTLRLRRFLNDYEFVVNSCNAGGGVISLTATRMVRKIGGLDEVNLDEVTEVDVGCRDKFFSDLEKSGRMKSWKKWSKIKWMERDFRPWLFNPVMYCCRCKLFKGGIHRTMVAKLLGHERLAVRGIKCWWEGERSCWGKQLKGG